MHRFDKRSERRKMAVARGNRKRVEIDGNRLLAGTKPFRPAIASF